VSDPGTGQPTMPPPSGSGGDQGGSAPSLPPPQGAVGAGDPWDYNKRIDGLWGVGQTRKAGGQVLGRRWVKVGNNSDSAIVALTALAAHAKFTQTTCNYRQGGDGLIHEIYVW